MTFNSHLPTRRNSLEIGFRGKRASRVSVNRVYLPPLRNSKKSISVLPLPHIIEETSNEYISTNRYEDSSVKKSLLNSSQRLNPNLSLQNNDSNFLNASDLISNNSSDQEEENGIGNLKEPEKDISDVFNNNYESELELSDEKNSSSSESLVIELEEDVKQNFPEDEELSEDFPLELNKPEFDDFFKTLDYLEFKMGCLEKAINRISHHGHESLSAIIKNYEKRQLSKNVLKMNLARKNLARY